MKVTYYVNAMMLLEGRYSRVLCDPWVTFDNNSNSGLFNFPPTRLTRNEVRSIQPDFIHITHTHADHLDPDTLRLFSRTTPCLIADYENNFTARTISKLGFTDIRVVDSEAGCPLNGSDHAWIQPSATYPEVDSIAGFQIDGQTIVNANDNPFHEGQCQDLRAKMGEIDLGCVPFAFQGPYPAFYENLPLEEKAAEADKKKHRNYQHVSGYARTLAPKHLFPFAAGALYGGQKALLFPYYGVGRAEEAVAIARNASNFKAAFLSEGMSIELPSGKINGTYVAPTHENKIDYIKRIAARPSPFEQGGKFWIDPEERIDLAPLLIKARERQDMWSKRTGRSSQTVFYIDVGAKRLYRMKIGEPSVDRMLEAEIHDEAYEIFRVPYPLMVGLLTKHYNWSNVKTQFISFYRQPNHFDADLHILMSFLQL